MISLGVYGCISSQVVPLGLTVGFDNSVVPSYGYNSVTSVLGDIGLPATGNLNPTEFLNTGVDIGVVVIGDSESFPGEKVLLIWPESGQIIPDVGDLNITVDGQTFTLIYGSYTLPIVGTFVSGYRFRAALGELDSLINDLSGKVGQTVPYLIELAP